MKFFKSLSRVAIVLVVGGALTAGIVKAQESQAPPANGGSGLSISPTRFLLNPEAGSTDVVTITVKNVTTDAITATPVINDFVSDDDTGTPKIVVDESRDDLPSIRPFFRQLEAFDIEAGESVTREFRVEIPTGTSAGGYYGLLRFLAAPKGVTDSGDDQVALTASVGSIVLIEIPGNVTEQVQVQNVLFYKGEVAGSFFTAKPEQIGVQIRNQGNGFVRPFGKVSVTNPFGKLTQQYEVNDINPRGNILPNSTRIFRDDISGVTIPGRYVATGDISYGNGGQILTIKKTFWYLPYWFIGVLLVVVALLTYGGFAVRRKVATGSFKRRK